MQRMDMKIAESMKNDIDNEIIFDEDGPYIDYLAGLDPIDEMVNDNLEIAKIKEEINYG